MGFFGKIFKGAKNLFGKAKHFVKKVVGGVHSASKGVSKVFDVVKSKVNQLKNIPVVKKVYDVIKQKFPNEVDLINKTFNTVDNVVKKVEDVSGKIENVVSN